MEVSFDALDELAVALKAGGVREASTDPAALNLPGVWVQATGITFDLLDGYTINARLVLIVADTGVARSMAALAELLTDVIAVVDPTDTVTATTATLPSNPARLPALAVPIDLTVTGDNA